MIRLQQNKLAAELHFDSVKSLITNRINGILKNGILFTPPGQSRNTFRLPTGDFRTMLENLRSEAALKNVICALPMDLPSITGMFKRVDTTILKKNTLQHHVITNIFIDHSYEKIDKLQFIKMINLDTCAYCNRNYIYALDKGYKIKPEIDHFYPQSKYPFLGVSFYNMIPSCQTCNGMNVKGSKDPDKEGLKNPYLLNSDDFLFSYDVADIQVNSPLADASTVTVKLVDKIEGHDNVFKLTELYKRHGDHVLELIIKSKVSYSKSYRAYLENYKHFNFGDAEINRMILGNYTEPEDCHRRPLAKLYVDIARELGLIPK